MKLGWESGRNVRKDIIVVDVEKVVLLVESEEIEMWGLWGCVKFTESSSCPFGRLRACLRLKRRCEARNIPLDMRHPLLLSFLLAPGLRGNQVVSTVATASSSKAENR